MLIEPKIRLHKATIILSLLLCHPACGGLAFAILSIVLLALLCRGVWGKHVSQKLAIFCTDFSVVGLGQMPG